jgi:flagellar hook-associated protein 1 FlgK
MNVYVGNEPLVLHGLSRGLTTTDSLDGEFSRTVVRFADTNGMIRPTGGMIAGLVESRETDAFGRLKELDDFAAAIIADVNAVHANGQGLTAFKSVTAGAPVDDPTAALNTTAAGLRQTPVNGSFYLTVTDDASGTPTAYRLDIDLDGADEDTSLEDLVAAINEQVTGVTAEVTTDNRLKLTADEGLSFTFGHDGQMYREDSSHLLAALGINTFFSGSSAADIAVRSELIEDPGLLAAASANHVGDGINAGRIGGLLDAASDLLNGRSIKEQYNTLANRVASAGAAAQEQLDAADAVSSALQAQRESVSGVSLDEEAVDLLRFERAFQGAARYVSTVDRLLEEMMGLVR